MISVSNVLCLLKACNHDYFEASRVIHKNYTRGIYTEEEYLEYMDILSSMMLWG